jgi:hypothetical protein
LESRPDRILVHGGDIKEIEIQKYSGQEYQQEYYWQICFSRFLQLIENKDCLHDCGPHAKCKCGICVSQAETNCQVPCSSCSKTQKNVGYLLFLGFLNVVFFLWTLVTQRKKSKFILVWVLMILLWVLFVKNLLHDEINMIMDIIQEEFNPSDHHFLVATFSY